MKRLQSGHGAASGVGLLGNAVEVFTGHDIPALSSRNILLLSNLALEKPPVALSLTEHQHFQLSKQIQKGSSPAEDRHVSSALGWHKQHRPPLKATVR